MSEEYLSFKAGWLFSPKVTVLLPQTITTLSCHIYSGFDFNLFSSKTRMEIVVLNVWYCSLYFKQSHIFSTGSPKDFHSLDWPKQTNKKTPA